MIGLETFAEKHVIQQIKVKVSKINGKIKRCAVVTDKALYKTKT